MTNGKIHWWHFALCSAVLLITPLGLPAVQAQDSLALNSSAVGSVEAGASQTWTFSAQSGQIVSLLVESASGDFDPQLTITDRVGNELIANDDYAYPETRDSLLEAITIPRTDTYRATVTGFNGTSGNFTITLFSGYAQFAERQGFSEEYTWEATGDAAADAGAEPVAGTDAEATPEAGDEGAGESFTVSTEAQQVTLAVTGANQHGIALGGLPPLTDMAARVLVQQVHNPTGWTVGMTARQNGDTYYLVEVNNNGVWRFSRVEDGTATVLRDWINHPNIVAGQTTFSMTLLANGAGFEFYYNDGFVGSVSDTTITGEGEVGLYVSTRTGQETTTTATFSDLVLTTPLLIDGQRIIPQQVIVSEGPVMAQALHQRHVVSAAGTMSLTVPESTVEYARPGIQRLMLGRGVAYTDFALGATVDIQPSIAGTAGCGLVFRFTSETNYMLAFLDATGGYGLSQREGEDFLPGLFGERAAFAGTGQHHLLVIARGDTLYYYVDGEYTGTLEAPSQQGQVGTAVVNFEGITNSCRFSNLWLWSWN